MPKEGERNTKSFHQATIQQRSWNKILRPKKEDGKWAETREEIEGECVHFFQGHMHIHDPQLSRGRTFYRPRRISVLKNYFIHWRT